MLTAVRKVPTARNQSSANSARRASIHPRGQQCLACGLRDRSQGTVNRPDDRVCQRIKLLSRTAQGGRERPLG